MSLGRVVLAIDGSTFISNNAADFSGNRVGGTSGGAIYRNTQQYSGGSLTVTGTTFDSSTAAGGAAVFSNDPATTFLFCNFTGNTASLSPANASLSAGGGALFLTQDGSSSRAVTISGCRFTSLNTAQYGGAVYVSGVSVNISSCVFDSNKAGWTGGAVYSDQSTSLQVLVSGTVFNGNSAGQGGAVFALAPTVIATSNFTSNTATCFNNTVASNGAVGVVLAQGGAVAASGNGLTLSSSLFTNNAAQCALSTASSRGGAIFTLATLTLQSVTLLRNQAASKAGAYGGAVFANRGADQSSVELLFTNVTSTNNSAVGSTEGPY